MSGWKRLGVVISVLWLIGSPIYWHVEVFRAIDKIAETCASNNPSAPQSCYTRRDHRIKNTAPIPDALKAMTFSDDRVDPTFKTWLGVMFWLQWLGPIALLWIVGGIVIGTTRWVIRGFTKSDTKRV